MVTEASEQPLFCKGVNGQITFDGSCVRISRKGALALMTQGLKGDKEILVYQISAVQFKNPGFTNGYIQFSFIGGQETKGGVFDATKDENTVMFSANHKKEFTELKDAIQAAIAAAHAAPPAPSTVAPAAPAEPDPIAQIQQLALLRDQGVLTPEEFETKKAELLSRL